MSNSPRAQQAHGSGSGRRTIPATRSPAANSPPSGASRTRPSDSWPSTRRSRPGGGVPYMPATISTSVPHTPSSSISTSSSPSAGHGLLALLEACAAPGSPGTTVIARIRQPVCRRAAAQGHGACGRPARTTTRLVTTRQRVVVVGGGFGGLEAVKALRTTARRRHADRPQQLPPVPAADVPGQHRRALARRDRRAAARDLPRRSQRARADGRGRPARPRAPPRHAAPRGRRAGGGDRAVRHARRGRPARATRTSGTTSGVRWRSRSRRSTVRCGSGRASSPRSRAPSSRRTPTRAPGG